MSPEGCTILDKGCISLSLDGRCVCDGRLVQLGTPRVVKEICDAEPSGCNCSSNSSAAIKVSQLL
jgi:hypothetical protein